MTRRDPHSYTNLDQGRVRHMNLSLTVDFDTSQLTGRALLQLAAPAGAELTHWHLCRFLAGPFGHYLKGWYMQTAFYLSDLGRREACLPYVRAILAYEPDNALAAIIAASALAAIGRTGEATTVIESCLAASAGHDDTETQKLRNMLRQLRAAGGPGPTDG